MTSWRSNYFLASFVLVLLRSHGGNAMGPCCDRLSDTRWCRAANLLAGRDRTCMVQMAIYSSGRANYSSCLGVSTASACISLASLQRTMYTESLVPIPRGWTLEMGAAARQLVELVEDADSGAAEADGAGAVLAGAVEDAEMGGKIEGGEGAGGGADVGAPIKLSKAQRKNKERGARKAAAGNGLTL